MSSSEAETMGLWLHGAKEDGAKEHGTGVLTKGGYVSNGT